MNFNGVVRMDWSTLCQAGCGCGARDRGQRRGPHGGDIHSLVGEAEGTKQCPGGGIIGLVSAGLSSQEGGLQGPS